MYLDNFKLLLGDAKLEYIALCFNHDCYLVGLSGVPDYKLVMWDWKRGVRLHSIHTSIRVSLWENQGLKNSY